MNTESIGVNAAGVAASQGSVPSGPPPPIFDLQGSISVMDPSNNSYAITCKMHDFRHHN